MKNKIIKRQLTIVYLQFWSRKTEESFCESEISVFLVDKNTSNKNDLEKRFLHVPAAPSLRVFSRGTFDQVFFDELGISCFVVVLKIGQNNTF